MPFPYLPCQVPEWALLSPCLSGPPSLSHLRLRVSCSAVVTGAQTPGPRSTVPPPGRPPSSLSGAEPSPLKAGPQRPRASPTPGNFVCSRSAVPSVRLGDRQPSGVSHQCPLRGGGHRALPVQSPGTGRRRLQQEGLQGPVHRQTSSSSARRQQPAGLGRSPGRLSDP